MVSAKPRPSSSLTRHAEQCAGTQFPSAFTSSHDMTTKKRIVDRHKTMDQASPLERFREPREVLAVSSCRRLLAIEDHQFADRDVQESRNLDESSRRRRDWSRSRISAPAETKRRDVCPMRFAKYWRVDGTSSESPTNRLINGMGVGLRHGTPSIIMTPNTRCHLHDMATSMPLSIWGGACPLAAQSGRAGRAIAPFPPSKDGMPPA